MRADPVPSADAHRYIEREAMDSRRTRREVAQAILRMYEGGC